MTKIEKKLGGSQMIVDNIYEKFDRIEKRLDLLEHDLIKLEELTQTRLKKIEEQHEHEIQMLELESQVTSILLNGPQYKIKILHDSLLSGKNLRSALEDTLK
jgi:hypothetical protein